MPRQPEFAEGARTGEGTSERRYAPAWAAGVARREAPAEAGLVARARRGFANWLKTAVITLGVLYVAGWFALTVGASMLNRTYAFAPPVSNTVQRSIAMEAMRKYALPKDPAITLDVANAAFVGLQAQPRPSAAFEQYSRGKGVVMPWKGVGHDPSVFPTAPLSAGVPRIEVIDLAGKGLTAKERQVLRIIGTAPLWRDWDVVARAPALDPIGARIRLPFGPAANLSSMPIMRFSVQRELANAAVSRAAWHMSEGRRDSAEAVLRGIVSYGFQMMDNATFPFELIQASNIVGVGRTALQKFHALANDPRAAQIEDEMTRAGRRAGSVSVGAGLADFNARRDAVLANVGDATLPRAVRLEMLSAFGRMSCGDGRELVAGARRETDAVFERAKRELARYPSERAVIDLMQHATETPARAIFGPQEQGILGTMDFVGRIYFNPRLAACALNGLTRGGWQ